MKFGKHIDIHKMNIPKRKIRAGVGVCVGGGGGGGQDWRVLKTVARLTSSNMC